MRNDSDVDIWQNPPGRWHILVYKHVDHPDAGQEYGFCRLFEMRNKLVKLAKSGVRVPTIAFKNIDKELDEIRRKKNG